MALIKHLRMLVRGNLPISDDTLSIDEIEKHWTEYDPNHKTVQPKNKKFTDFIYGARRVAYRSFVTGKMQNIISLMRVPHAFLLGQEMYGKRETVTKIRE